MFNTNLLEACEIQNPEFTCVTVNPIMPVNPIWKKEREQKLELGLILETQNVACERDRMHLGRCWWPLARAQLSRSLHVRKQRKEVILAHKRECKLNSINQHYIQVVLGTTELSHVRLSNPLMSLNLHDPTIFLSPENTSRRTIGSLAM